MRSKLSLRTAGSLPVSSCDLTPRSILSRCVLIRSKINSLSLIFFCKKQLWVMFLVGDHLVVPVEQTVETLGLRGGDHAIVGKTGEFILYP